MPYEQQQRPEKGRLTPEDAETIARLTRRESYMQFSAEDVLLMWDTAPAPCLMVDFKRFVYIASAKHLNPILNDIHLEYRYSQEGPKCSIVTHQDGLLKIAHRSKLLDGIVPKDGKDERGWYVETSVIKKGCSQPFVFRAYHDEFVGTKQGGAPNYMWAKMPYNMTAKCSRAGALRLAFPEECAGIMDEAEMHGDDEPRDTAPAQDQYAIGEKKTEPVAGVPEPAPAPTSESRPAAAPAPAPTPAPAEAKAEPKPAAVADTPAQQYKARLKVLLSSTAWGLTKADIDGVLLGYFGVDKLANVPKDPVACLKLLDDLVIYLAERGSGELKTDPVKFGAFRKLAVNAKAPNGAASAPAPAAAPPPALPNVNVPDPLADAVTAVKAQFPGWRDEMCVVAARLIQSGMCDSAAALDQAIKLPIFAGCTEPMLEIAFLIGYYDADGLAAVLQRYQKTKMPLNWFLNEIQKYAGGTLASFAIDPAKVKMAVGKTLADPAVR